MRQKKVWTEGEKLWLIKNFPTTENHVCAKFLNTTKDIIIYQAQKLNLAKIKSWTEEEDKFLQQHFPINGYKFCQIELRKTFGSVRARVKSLKLKKIKLEKIINSKLFVEMSTPEAVYIAGFLWADGHVTKKYNRVSMSIVSEDMDKILHLFEKFGEWIITTVQFANSKTQTCIATHNKEIYNFFCEMDYKDKSYIEPTKILNKIPKNLKHYWWRGFVDGDGSFSLVKNRNRKSTSIAGTRNYKWTETINLFYKLEIEKYNIQTREGKNEKGVGSSIIELTNYRDITIFGNYIYQNYQNDKIGLLRKYEKYESIKNRGIKKPRYKVTLINIKTDSIFYFSSLTSASEFLKCSRPCLTTKLNTQKIYKDHLCHATT